MFALPLEQHVGLADRIGFRVDLLAVEAGHHLLPKGRRQLAQGFVGHGEHAAGTAGVVVEQIGATLHQGGNRAEHQRGHQPHGIARRPVLTRFLVVLLVEAAHQLFEQRAHGVVVERRRA